MYAYIAGVVCNDRFMDININSSVANTTLSIISITVNFNGKYALLSLYISYVMYTDSNNAILIKLYDPTDQI